MHPIRRAAASRPLREFLETLPVTPTRLAAWLGLSPERLESCVRFESRIPRRAQWRLAVLAAEVDDPRLARRGRRLRTQLEATAAYQAHATTVHARGSLSS